MTHIYLTLILYLGILLAIGIYYSRKSQTVTDFLLAGRSLKLLPAVLTLTATMFGGGMLTGSIEYAYLNGPMIFFYALGSLFGVCGVGLLIKRMAEFSSYTTVTEYLEKRYNSPFLRLACSFLSMVALIGILGSQVSAVVGALDALGLKNAALGAALAMSVIIALTTLGGLWAVTMTDCFQILLVIIGVVWITAAALHAHGGYGNVIAELDTLSPTLPKDYTTLINGEKSIALLWAILPMIMYELIGQDVYQRLFACRTEKIARKTAYISGILLGILTLPPVILGLIARLDFPDLSIAGNTTSAFARLCMTYLPDMAVGIIFAAIFAAILSTADSILTAATSHFMNDFWIKFSKSSEGPDSRKLLTVSRIVSLLFGVSAVIVSMFIPQVITLQIYAYTLYTAGAFIPIVLGVLWKKTTKQGAIAGLITGSIVAVLGISGINLGAIPVELFGAVAAAVITVLVSLATCGSAKNL